MGYELDAYVADEGTIDALLERAVGMTKIGLRSGVAMALGPDGTDLPSWEGVISGLTVAHVAAEYFGGAGYQSAWFFRHGAMIWSEVAVWTAARPDRTNWPINRALADLGVVPGPRSWGEEAGAGDCFDEVGLSLRRSNSEWLRIAAAGGVRAAAMMDECELERRVSR